ncbi:head-tail connector protein [Streptococcus pluranimalium]|uniref:Head-tail connector protein n=1 Tax=Helcococcus bovis TaxID=3153252 RepID=A0ABW9F6Y0_9FIRM|nr:head-tail connector protein [Streptococcus agalactiae]HEM2695162.1 phage gp6-like head-tail connector protein [Streptococcus suis]KAF1268414.1 AraC family transcriptional regulator [Streptococcus agalactiae]MCD0152347.1 phage gp6-like head-tail connector protein [Streptococcus agalactiae]RRA51986.1 phage gp6-like head-tail connector protein [Streptococcus agalactiae]HEM2709485.1 phage gp6-like head-tail connector protein [Streptococcus suis]
MSPTLEEVKQYVRVDSSDDDLLLESLLATSKQLCMHILRVDETSTLLLCEEVKTAILYSVAYLYEHREEANHKELTLTLRSLLFGIRKAEF